VEQILARLRFQQASFFGRYRTALLDGRGDGRTRRRLLPGDQPTHNVLSGHLDGALALGVLGGERSERFARLVELVGLLYGDPEGPGL
jgi:hypothetical protein